MERMFYPNNPSNSYFFHENPSPSHLLTFPSPLLNDEDLLFASSLHYKPLPTAAATTFASGDKKPPMDSHGRRTEIEEGESTVTESRSKPQVAPTKRKRGGVKKQPATRRAGKKDRHSKIYTAQGCRDRRMRLSLQIARMFFDLQDMLGFDKASKTIEWLFSKSMSAIRDLTESLPPHLRRGDLMGSTVNADRSSTSVSLESTGVKGNLDVQKDELKLMNDKKSPNLISSLARESREKARARARQRTMEKRQKGLMLEKSPSQEKCNNSSSSKLGTSSTSETVYQVESGGDGYSALENQIPCASFIEKLLGSDHSSVARSSIYDDTSYMGLPSNWVADSMRTNTIYGAVTDVDELKVILQHQNPSRSASVPGKSASSSSTR